MKQFKDKRGYLSISLIKNKISKSLKVHRLVAKTFIANPHNKPQINHKDGNKSNNFVENLEWCDNSENQKHAYRLGLQPSRKGSLNGNAKINEVMANEIRVKYSTGCFYQKDIAKMYGLTQGSVTHIITNKRWNNSTN